MTTVVYPAVIHLDAAGLRASFVDFEDVEVRAQTEIELLRLAREALMTELQRREREGDGWPTASPIGAADTAGGGSILLVDVAVDDPPVRLTISIGERLLRRIDEDAAKRSMTRSGYLAAGALRLLDDPSAPFGEAGDAVHNLKEEIAAIGRRMNEALGPGSPVVRTLNELDGIALDGFRRLGGEIRSAMRSRRRNEEPPPRGPDAPK